MGGSDLSVFFSSPLFPLASHFLNNFVINWKLSINHLLFWEKEINQQKKKIEEKKNLVESTKEEESGLWTSPWKKKDGPVMEDFESLLAS